MAEAFLNHLAGDKFVAESAGLEPLEINPFVVEVMAEREIDLKEKKPIVFLIFTKRGVTTTMLLHYAMRAVEINVYFSKKGYKITLEL